MSKRAPPKLPLSAFAPQPVPSRRAYPEALIDTHVHLITSAQVESGNVVWPKSEGRKGTVLSETHELEFYDQVISSAVKNGLPKTRLEGFLFVQAEAKHDDSDTDGSKGGWDSAIDEVDAVCKAALASPNAVKLLGLVPWAPIHHGRKALDLYLARLEALPSYLALSPKKDLIKSFRYLLEESPAGFFLTDDFIDGLKWCGEKGFAFDMTLDAGSTGRGTVVLEEAIECITKVHKDVEESKQTRFVLDHFAKPDLLNAPTFPLAALQRDNVTLLFSLSLLPNLYLKLSGLLNCFPPELVKAAFEEFRATLKKQEAGFKGHERLKSVVGLVQSEPENDTGTAAAASEPSTGHIEGLKKRILTFLEPALESFGEERILTGSDHPMFRLPIISPHKSIADRDLVEEAAAYEFQVTIYRQILTELGLEGEALDRVFAGNAKEFYRIGSA